MWTPVLTPRIGYCEYNCTLCTEVCPTGALEVLSQPRKHTWRMGTAYFDNTRCIPWAENNTCLVCEEVCPTPTKAIHFRDVSVLDDNDVRRVIKRPYVVETSCVGCGHCEFVCPVEGAAAIRVAARFETRHLLESVEAVFAEPPGDDPYGAVGIPADGFPLDDEPTSPTEENGGKPDDNPYG
jgi:ferredoxin